ncbi:MAG: DUF4132 domain-containing protein, partial [Verrucomicrobiota bacterium]|nr:DUF4132 domain-containing protein [Verrucomicrobiota bacterium]
MQHLVDILQAKSRACTPTSSLKNLPRDLQLIEQYLRTGDAQLELALLQIPETHMTELKSLAEAVPRIDAWTDADRRLVRFFALQSRTLIPRPGARSDYHDNAIDELSARVLSCSLEQERPEEDWFAPWRAELLSHGISPGRITKLTARHARPLAVDNRFTSAGRFLAALPADQLAGWIHHIARKYHGGDFIGLFISDQPDRFVAVAESLVQKDKVDSLPPAVWQRALESDSARFERIHAAAFRAMHNPDERFELGLQLIERFPGKYEEAVWQRAPAALSAAWRDERIARWMLKQRGAEALPAIQKHLQESKSGWKISLWEVLDEAVQALGSGARPAVLTALQRPPMRQKCIAYLIGFHDPADDAQIESLLAAELSAEASEQVIGALPIAAEWHVERIAPRVWPLLEHKSKPVRDAAVPVLAKLGSAALAQARALLGSRKADSRIAAAKLLGAIGTPEAVETLRKALDVEKSDNVADAIRAALPRSGEAPGEPGEAATGAGSREAVLAAIKKAAAKGKVPASWLALEKLPPLTFDDGSALDLDAVRALLFRQSRSKAIEPDSEARPLYALIDRGTSGDFALAVLQGFLGSGADAGDRWALAVAGLLGDERIVPILTTQIDQWADTGRGKLAEYGVQALALQASDAALLAVDALAIRYRTKFKNIGNAAAEAFAKAAESRGLSSAELGDRVVPWLGFEPGKPRVVACGAVPVEVNIGLDFKIRYRDSAKNKRLPSLPGSAPAEIRAEMKELAGALKDAAKAQLLRLDNLMVQQHRWPAARWRELFLQHPLLVPFAVRLVWTAYDETGALGSTFRALEDRTLTGA